MKKIIALFAFMFCFSSLSFAQFGISGGSIIYVNVVIDTALNLSTLTADSVVSNYVSTSELLADSAKVDTVISAGGASFGDDVKIDSTITADSAIVSKLKVATLTGIAKFSAGIVSATDTIHIPRVTGLQDSLDINTDTTEAQRVELNLHKDTLNSLNTRISAAIQRALDSAATHRDSIAALRANINTHATGAATIGAGDSVRVTITGLTTSGIAITAYKKSAAFVPDTAATWFIWENNALTIFGKYNQSVSYWIGKN